MNSLLVIIRSTMMDLVTAFLNLFIWRSKKVWIIGGWFGSNFSDNSRFLYQYLQDNSAMFNIKKIIWITRKVEVYNKIISMGYEDVVMCNSLKGFYYHLKAGVHFICNSIGDSAPGDINTYLSFGAKKIQLWHGVGIKACAYLRKNSQRGFRLWLSKNIIHKYLKPGVWGKCYQVVTSEENARVTISDLAVMRDRIINCWYPRFCECPRLFPEEKTLIQFIKDQHEKKIILFLPTFKNSLDNYIAPTQIEGFEDFLINNHIIWIQKCHSADQRLNLKSRSSDNIIVLQPEFDVNVLYDYIHLLITDYSSATTDAIAKDKLTMEYCPDYEYYRNHDRGFVNDFDKYHTGNIVYDPNMLFDKINECFSKDLELSEKHKEVKSFLVGDKVWQMDEIIQKIKEVAKI